MSNGSKNVCSLLRGLVGPCWLGKKRKYTNEKEKEEREEKNEDRNRLDWMISEERRKSLESDFGWFCNN